MNNSTNIQLLNAVFFLAAMQNIELCYNPQDGQIYQVRERSKEDVTLLPLNVGVDTPIFDYNPSKLIFRDGIFQRSENIGSKIDIISIETDSKQPTIQPQNSIGTAPKPGSNSEETKILALQKEKTRAFIGVGKVDLPKFAAFYTGDTAKYAAQVECLLDRIFAATNKPLTIQKSIEDYNNAKKYAKNGQVYELKQLVERLQGRLNKQAAMQSAKDTMAAQSTAKRKMIFSAVIAVAVVLLYFWVSSFQSSHKEVLHTQPQTETSTYSELDRAIMEWEQTTGKRIYPAGRKCLAKSTKGMTKDQIIRVIQQNVK